MTGRRTEIVNCTYLRAGTCQNVSQITSKSYKSFHFDSCVVDKMALVQLSAMQTAAVCSAIPSPLRVPQLECRVMHHRLSFTSCPRCLTRLLSLMLLSVRHHATVLFPSYILFAAPAFSPPTVSCIQSTYQPLHSIHLCPLHSVHPLPPTSNPPTAPYIQSIHCPLQSVQLPPLHSVHPLSVSKHPIHPLHHNTKLRFLPHSVPFYQHVHITDSRLSSMVSRICTPRVCVPLEVLNALNM